jgi:hypothetical protein
MDRQMTFKALTEEATGTTVRQINETKLKDALKMMDANPDTWGKSLEAFINAWLAKASQPDNVQGTPLPDQEKKTLFVKVVKCHPVAIAAIQQQEGIEKVLKCQFPNQLFVTTFDNLIDDIRMTCQQYDNVQGVHTAVRNPAPKDNVWHANAAMSNVEKT